MAKPSVLVTGAGIGIGEAAAHAFAAAGYHVYVTDILEDEGRATADAIGAAGGTAAFHRVDVTDTANVDAVVAAGSGAGRLIHRWLAQQGVRPSRAQVESLVRIATSGGPSAGLDLAGARAERRYEVLVCRPAATAASVSTPPPRAWAAPGEVELGSGWRLSAETAGDERPSAGRGEVIVDAARVEGELTVRTARPGDRIRLRGGRRKLSDVFIDARIPRAERPGLAVVTRGADIVWVPGVALAFGVLPGAKTERWMRLRAERLDCRTPGSVVETQAFRVKFG